MKHKLPRNILLMLLGILGLGAIGGGAVFIISPDGKLMGMPLSVLNRSPFSSFLFPGIILFLVLGVLPIWIIWALIKKPSCRFAEKVNFFTDMHWSWSFNIYVAFVLIIWIQLQMVFLPEIIDWQTQVAQVRTI
jgi:hypothetical protein